MQFDALEPYEGLIRYLATRLVRSGQLDHNAADVEDYQSRLRIVSWDAQVHFRRRGVFCSSRERRYVSQVLRNAAVDFVRQRSRVEAHARSMADLYRTFTCHCDDDRLEAREALRVLSSVMGDDFWLLIRVAECRGRVSDSYVEGDGSYETYRSRIRRLRRKAKKILETGAEV